MVNYLLDTNVLSEARHPRGAQVVKDWLASVETLDPFVSTISVGEIAFGAALLMDRERSEDMQRWLTHVRATYGARILPVDADIAEFWGQSAAAARKRGVTIAVSDGLIAATARVHSLHVATRNVQHLLEAGAPVFDPWTGQTHEPQV